MNSFLGSKGLNGFKYAAFYDFRISRRVFLIKVNPLAGIQAGT